MGDVELDRPTATGFQVREQQPVLRPEQIARVRLAVKQLLGGVTLTDYRGQLPQRDDEPVARVDARHHPRIERSDRATGFGEPTSDLDFELCASLALHVRDP